MVECPFCERENEVIFETDGDTREDVAHEKMCWNCGRLFEFFLSWQPVFTPVIGGVEVEEVIKKLQVEE